MSFKISALYDFTNIIACLEDCGSGEISTEESGKKEKNPAGLAI